MSIEEPQEPRWNDLDRNAQLQLLEEYGHHLDELPASCDMDTKIDRFRSWLALRGIRYGTGRGNRPE